MSFRFNRDKRFGVYNYNEFLTTATRLLELVRQARPTITAELLTCEYTELATSHVAVSGEGGTFETIEFLAYPTHHVDPALWDRMIDMQVRIDDPGETEPFVVTMTCSRRPRTNRMYFYGQCVDLPTFRAICDEFSYPSLHYSIGTELDRKSVIGAKEPRRVA